MAFAGSLHPQVDVNFNGETGEKIKAGEYWPAPNDRELDAIEIISDIWERPPDRHLHVFVSIPGIKKGNITELTLDIEAIDKKINEELESLRKVVKIFLKDPEPPTWNPPDFVPLSDRKFITNLRIPSYPNGSPSLLFHNLDECDDREIEMIFGSYAHQYVVINCALNTSQHVQAGVFATHLARAKPVACWKAS